MVNHVHSHAPQRPRTRSSAGVDRIHFFPGEAAHLLGATNPEASLDYAQLRRLLAFVREELGADPPRKGWSRWTFTDLAAGRTVLSLAGGLETLAPGRRLMLKPIRDACDALRGQGHRMPLMEVPMARFHGRIVVLERDGVLEPVSGQLVVAGMLAEAERFMDNADVQTMTALRREASTIVGERAG